MVSIWIIFAVFAFASIQIIFKLCQVESTANVLLGEPTVFAVLPAIVPSNCFLREYALPPKTSQKKNASADNFFIEMGANVTESVSKEQSRY